MHGIKAVAGNFLISAGVQKCVRKGAKPKGLGSPLFNALPLDPQGADLPLRYFGKVGHRTVDFEKAPFRFLIIWQLSWAMLKKFSISGMARN